MLAYRIIHDKNKTKTPTTTQNSAANNTSKTSDNTANNTAPAADTSTVAIKEWGVKVTLRDASKVKISVVANTTGGMFMGETPYEAEAIPSFAAGAVQDDSCKTGVTMVRSKESLASSTNQKKIGDYYYAVTGSPQHCENSADDQLHERILQDFLPSNLSVL